MPPKRPPRTRTVFTRRDDAPKYAAVVPMICKNPKCGKTYWALAWRVKQGRGLYCHRQCGWSHRRREGWYVCQQCHVQFYRVLRGYRKPPKFHNRDCYLRNVKGIQTLEDWRTTLAIR